VRRLTEVINMPYYVCMHSAESGETINTQSTMDDLKASANKGKSKAEIIAEESEQPLHEVEAFLALGYEWTNEIPSGYKDSLSISSHKRAVKNGYRTGEYPKMWFNRKTGRAFKVRELPRRNVLSLKAGAYRPRGYRTTESYPVWAWTTEPFAHHSSAPKWYAYRSVQLASDRGNKWKLDNRVDHDSILGFATRKEAKAHVHNELDALRKWRKDRLHE